ncbi:RHS repeat protein [Maribacter sp. 4G9]|uniref:RHS repeat protein n=1 Tax=Maribacter sp. 4G9 TaxID=1889777 RepID=UPI000C3CAC99|nr:RHS repeat-associated core domain-containing protein [Maribacter sp. 4G9]PIB39405.1 hypothetical protein BFP75_12585 [Maribacter sp. 4G9]
MTAVVQLLRSRNSTIGQGFADYYPFGMQMPGPNNSLNSAAYRYAFQGQEKDSETGKEAFELRLWDSRIGRWLTTDPADQYSSPYLGMGNNPINGIDSDGAFWEELYNWIDGKGWNSNAALDYEAKGGFLNEWSGNKLTGYRNAASVVDGEVVGTRFAAVNDFWSGIFNPKTLQIFGGRLAIGYNTSLNGDAMAAVYGVGGGLVGTNLMFIGGDYGGYWYTYGSVEGGPNVGTGIGGSGSLNGDIFIAYNISGVDVTPGSYTGIYGSLTGNLEVTEVVGANISGGLTIAPGNWVGLNVGAGFNLGGKVSAEAQVRIGNTWLLTPDVRKTRDRTALDLISNHLSKGMMPNSVFYK